MTIKQTILDVLNQLATLPVTSDGQTSLYTRIWNGQIKEDEDGTLGYNFPKPAVFVEVMNDQAYETIGGGYQAADIVFRLHLAHEFYNNEGTFEQDLPVYDWRDRIIALLSLFKPSGCGSLVKKSEGMDYNHRNIYHYIIDFTCNFVDSAAVPTQYSTTPPLSLEVDVTEGHGGGQQGDGAGAPNRFIINT